MPDAIKLEQAKSINAALVKTLFFVIGLGVVAISWYMVTLNVTQKETNVLLAALDKQYEKLDGRFDLVKEIQVSQASDDKLQTIRINGIEKEQELLKMQVKNHGETLKSHDLLIRDKRRCIGCEK